MNDQLVDKIWALIAAAPIGMYVPFSPSGRFKAVPMTTHHDPGEDRLWFFAPHRSHVATAAQHEPHVYISYANPAVHTYVWVTGRAHISTDLDRKRRLWSPAVQAWLETGPEDASVELIGVEVIEAEYWKPRENRVGQLLTLVRAVMAGTVPVDTAEHGRIDRAVASE